MLHGNHPKYSERGLFGWSMFRHSSDATLSWPAVLALREDALLVVSEDAAFGRTPACNFFSDEIKAFSCKETALGLTRQSQSRVLKGPVHTLDFCGVFHRRMSFLNTSCGQWGGTEERVPVLLVGMEYNPGGKHLTEHSPAYFW